MSAIGHMASRVLVNGVYYRALEMFPGAAPMLTRSVARGLGAFSASLRSVVAENARLALGGSATAEDVHRVTSTVILRMQNAIRDTLSSSTSTADALADRIVDFSGQDGYHRARAHARGMLVASIHMGSFEPCLALLRKYESRVHVLFHPDPMPRFEQARSRMRASIGIVEHRVSDGVDAWIALRDALEANEVVVMHADRVMPRQHGARMSFLGIDDAVLPTGPVRLAVGCGAAIVPAFCTHGAGGLAVTMDDPICMPQEILRSHEVPGHAAQRQLVASMERAIRGSPDQWLAFWRVRGGAP